MRRFGNRARRGFRSRFSIRLLESCSWYYFQNCFLEFWVESSSIGKVDLIMLLSTIGRRCIDEGRVIWAVKCLGNAGRSAILSIVQRYSQHEPPETRAFLLICSRIDFSGFGSAVNRVNHCVMRGREGVLINLDLCLRAEVSDDRGELLDEIGCRWVSMNSRCHQEQTDCNDRFLHFLIPTS